MSADYHDPVSQKLLLRGRTALLAGPEDLASEVHNFRLTRNGNLRKVPTPAELVPRYYTAASGYTLRVNYGAMKGILGIGHFRLDDHGARDVLLIHNEDGVRVFQGWEIDDGGGGPIWETLIGPGGQVDLTLPDDGLRPSPPTEFIRSPSGIIILVAGLRPYLYDGYSIHEWGYQTIPNPPSPDSPESQETYASGSLVGDLVNASGYSVTGRTLPGALGTGRYGTLDNTVVATDGATRKVNELGGVMYLSQHLARTQWYDFFGNLSPLSEPSAPATCSPEKNLMKAAASDPDEKADRMRYEIRLGDVALGPGPTKGRMVAMTRDIETSGDPTYYYLPSSVSGSAHGHGTVQDNIVRSLPCNIDATWSSQRAIPVLPMPNLRHGAVAMGRFWGSAGGVLHGSYPGRYGTMDPVQVYVPDIRGADITAVHGIADGLLVFTVNSVCLLEPNDDGASVRIRQLSSTVGTASPGSVQTHRSGAVMWRSGARSFHVYLPGEGVRPLPNEHIQDILNKVNPSWVPRTASCLDPESGAYRCWIALQGSSENNICVEFDGTMWRTRDDLYAQAACNSDTPDSVGLVLGSAAVLSGQTPGRAVSLFAVDREALWTRELAFDQDHDAEEVPVAPEAKIETPWLRISRAYRKGSPKRIFAWFVETHSGGLKHEVMRDGREFPVIQTVEAADTGAASLHSVSDPPSFVGTAVLGAAKTYPMATDSRGRPLQDSERWRERRHYMPKIDIHVPSVNTFKVRLTASSDFEFVALAYQEGVFPWHGGSTMDTAEGET